eukprot:CAMPEP_0174856508 /NCGR_PEP_ID=MMETSP1114-20130205/36072_1 /TAXON_ID=312471 /ORGANISM="Neobodo designis, Strain CCAP 1951/1" /LENGTH=151 /DNA_ID=CAMNT_0016091307 /DNA_START=138 /DNA_END=593 /DNA_ORIENTATION=+
MHRRLAVPPVLRARAGVLAVTASARTCTTQEGGKLLRPVDLASDAQMLRPRDAFFGYVGHSEPVAVVFPLARGEQWTVPAVSTEVELAMGSAAASPGVVVNGELHAEPASVATPAAKRSRTSVRPRRRTPAAATTVEDSCDANACASSEKE